MTPLDIDDAFDGYMRATNPSVAQHTPQYRESRRCFMAGMWQMLQHMLRVAELLNDEGAERELARVEDQLVQFKQRVAQDKD
jgi:hypothetical protein